MSSRISFDTVVALFSSVRSKPFSESDLAALRAIRDDIEKWSPLTVSHIEIWIGDLYKITTRLAESNDPREIPDTVSCFWVRLSALFDEIVPLLRKHFELESEEVIPLLALLSNIKNQFSEDQHRFIDYQRQFHVHSVSTITADKNENQKKRTDCCPD